MSKEVFKSPVLSRTMKSSSQKMTATKRRKSREKFLQFCDIVLSYTQYEQMKQQDLRHRNNVSPLDSGGSAAESFSEESSASSPFTDDDSYLTSPYTASTSKTDTLIANAESPESVTCFCTKPFAGRPMIECSNCNTWIHLSCAKIRRTSIPDIYICQMCRDSQTDKRKSGRVRSGTQRLDM